VPNQGHDKRTFRMADEPWKAFEAACAEAGVTPQAMLRTLVLWYSRQPGVTVRRPKSGQGG
jgi:hypothetical protein